MSDQNTLALGKWNVICDRCGFKFKNTDVKKEWNNSYVCKGCFEPRHPMDFFRGKPDDSSVPWSRPDDSEESIAEVSIDSTVTSSGLYTVDTTNEGITTTLDSRWYDSESLDISLATPLREGDSDMANYIDHPRDVQFSPDGVELYITNPLIQRVHQWTLSTAWDISTASYVGDFSHAQASGVAFKTDGTKMYVSYSFLGSVSQFTLSTPWLVTSASSDGIGYTPSAYNSFIGLEFNSTGTKFFAIAGSINKILQHSLSTPWVMDTGSYDSVSFDASGETANQLQGFEFTSDGSQLLVMIGTENNIYEYDLPIPWVLTGYSFTGNIFSVGAQDSDPRPIALGNSDRYLYMVGNTTDTVYQYDSGKILYDSSGWPRSGDVVTITNTGTTGNTLTIRGEDSDLTYTIVKVTDIPSTMVFTYGTTTWELTSYTPTGL